jgi:hypothetical protein
MRTGKRRSASAIMNPELAAIGVFHFCSAEASHIPLGESRSIEAVPLYAVRIEDLGPGDFVKVDCTACCRRLLRLRRAGHYDLARLTLTCRKTIGQRGREPALVAVGGQIRSKGPGDTNSHRRWVSMEGQPLCGGRTP